MTSDARDNQYTFYATTYGERSLSKDPIWKRGLFWLLVERNKAHSFFSFSCEPPFVTGEGKTHSKISDPLAQLAAGRSIPIPRDRSRGGKRSRQTNMAPTQDACRALEEIRVGFLDHPVCPNAAIQLNHVYGGPVDDPNTLFAVTGAQRDSLYVDAGGVTIMNIW